MLFLFLVQGHSTFALALCNCACPAGSSLTSGPFFVVTVTASIPNVLSSRRKDENRQNLRQSHSPNRDYCSSGGRQVRDLFSSFLFLLHFLIWNICRSSGRSSGCMQAELFLVGTQIFDSCCPSGDILFAPRWGPISESDCPVFPVFSPSLPPGVALSSLCEWLLPPGVLSVLELESGPGRPSPSFSLATRSQISRWRRQRLGLSQSVLFAQVLGLRLLRGAGEAPNLAQPGPSPGQ